MQSYLNFFKEAIKSQLKTVEEMQADNERIMEGGEPLTDSKNTVQDVPNNFKNGLLITKRA